MSDPKPVHGILKHSVAHARAASIQWDEHNLEVNEAEKVPRMKIDEPKTPFHVLDDNDDPCELARPNINTAAASNTLPMISPKAAMQITQAAMQRRTNEWEDDDDVDMDQNDYHDSGDEVEISDGAAAKHKSDFKQQRRAHYNEFQAVKMAMQRKMDEDDDE